MKKMKKFAAALLALSCVFAVGGLTACKDKDKSSVAIEMDIDKIAITMKIGDKNSIVPTVVGTEEISFTSSDTNVATVDDKGNVTAVGIGKAEITVKAGDVTKVCRITVVNISVSNVFFREADVKVSIGGEKSLITVVEPLIATNKAVTYASSDATVATVDAEGKVKGVKEGTAKITVTTVDGEKKAECTVTVGKAVAEITLSNTEVSVAERKTVKVVETITPSDAIIKDVIWKSSNESVVAVAGGELMGIKAGTATVTATTVDGKKVATVAVTVTPYKSLTGVNIVKEDINLAAGATTQVAAAALPTDATDCELVWSSSNPAVVSVNSAGEARGRSVGTATLTATSKDDDEIKDTVQVHVVDGATTFYNKYYAPSGSFTFPVYNVTEVKYNGTALSAGEFTNENNVVTIAKSVLVGKSSSASNSLTFVSADSGDATVAMKMAYATPTTFSANELGTEIFAANENILSSSVEDGKAVFNMKSGASAYVGLNWDYLDAMFAYPSLEQLTFKLSVEGISATSIANRLVNADGTFDTSADTKTIGSGVDLFLSRVAYNQLKAVGTQTEKDNNLNINFMASTVGANAKIKIDYLQAYYGDINDKVRGNRIFADASQATSAPFDVELSTTADVLTKLHFGVDLELDRAEITAGTGVGTWCEKPYSVVDGNVVRVLDGTDMVRGSHVNTNQYPGARYGFAFETVGQNRVWLATENSSEVWWRYLCGYANIPASQTFTKGTAYTYAFELPADASLVSYEVVSATLDGTPIDQIEGVSLVTGEKGATGIAFAASYNGAAGKHRLKVQVVKTVLYSTNNRFSWASTDLYDRQITVNNA